MNLYQSKKYKKGIDRSRTGDLSLTKRMLCQLSYYACDILDSQISYKGRYFITLEEDIQKRGVNRARTGDLSLTKGMLYQLSYYAVCLKT